MYLTWNMIFQTEPHKFLQMDGLLGLIWICNDLGFRSSSPIEQQVQCVVREDESSFTWNTSEMWIWFRYVGHTSGEPQYPKIRIKENIICRKGRERTMISKAFSRHGFIPGKRVGQAK